MWTPGRSQLNSTDGADTEAVYDYPISAVPRLPGSQESEVSFGMGAAADSAMPTSCQEGLESAPTMGPFHGLSAALEQTDSASAWGHRESGVIGAAHPGEATQQLDNAAHTLPPPSTLRRVNELGDSVPGSQDSAVPAGSQDATLASAAGRALNLDVSSTHEPGRRAEGHTNLFCPVPGCPNAAAGRRPEFSSAQRLRAHVDAHLLAQLPGLPPQEWMDQRGMVACRLCGRMVSRRCNRGVHRTCLATELAPGHPRATQAAPAVDAEDLPSLRDICLARIETREFIGASLLPAVEREFNKCTANVIAFSRPDAWSHVGTERDSDSHHRARRVWTEWFMFAKTCLLVLPGGKAKEKRNNNIVANRIARWAAGERMSLWEEGLRMTKADRPARPSRKRKNGGDEKLLEQELERKREEVIDLARRGLPGKAVSHASSLGLAPDTAATERIMRSKFVAPPATQSASASRRSPTLEANTITDEGVVKAVRSFGVGVSAGPSGQRPDLYKQMIGEKGDKPAVPLLSSLSNLLASGQAPPELRPYFGGAKGTALRKTAKDGSDDARPACSGETMRRIVGKVLLGTDIETLSDHLLPHQLAVGVRAGVEAMPHVVRQWRDDNANDNAKVWINFDEGNAHNEVDRHTFLMRMREIAPGMMKWLEYIYPTDVPTYVLYRGRVIHSESGGQQRCPLIGACHAAVKRMVHESLGIIPPLEGSAIHLPHIDRAVELDIAPLFADDGVVAGNADEVLRAIQHMKKVMPMVGLRFSQLQVAAAAYGIQPEEKFATFKAEGCTPVLDGNVEVLKSPIGDAEFSRSFCLKVAAKQREVLTFLAELGDPHVSQYLLKWCVNGGRMNYMARTTPCSATHDAALAFDKDVAEAFAASCNLALSDRQRSRVNFSVKNGGIGLRSIADRVDGAYVASRAATHELCRRIRLQHRGDHANRDPHLRHAMASLEQKVGDSELLGSDLDKITQSKLNEEIDGHNRRQWMEEADPAEQVHLKAYSGLGCGFEMDLVPSKALDMNLTRGEFVTTVARRLGVDVMEGNVACGFCGILLDAGGLHAISCMAGGDATEQHNGVRDVYFDYCERGALRPLSEAPDVLKEVLGRDDRRRPADVLCIPALALARRLPDGSRAIRTEPVCFDFAVINALGLGHWADTAAAAGSAADKYGEGKKTRNNTEALCTDAGYRFWPVVHETQGGLSKEAEAATRAIASAVADREGRVAGTVRRELLSRVAAVIARTSARAVHKREVRRIQRRPPWSEAVARARTDAEAAEETEEMFF